MASTKKRETPANRKAQELTTARDERRAIRVHRRLIEAHHADVFVVGVGAEWVLLQPVRDRIDLDGYEALRLRDISKIEECPRAAFIDAVLRKRKQKPTPSKKVRLDTTDSLLVSATGAWPLVAIHREKRDTDVCDV